MDRQPLLREYFRGLLRDLLVDRAKKHRQSFEYGYFGAETPPYATHFKADHTRAHHTEALRHLRNRERARVRQNQLFIEVGAGQRARIGTGRNDDLLGDQRFRRLAADFEFDAIGARFNKAAAPLKKLNLVLLEQVHDAVVVLLDHFVFARQHLPDVNGESFDLDAMLG